MADWLAHPTSDHGLESNRLITVGASLHRALHFSIILALSRYDLNNDERDVKHQITIIIIAIDILDFHHIYIYIAGDGIMIFCQKC